MAKKKERTRTPRQRRRYRARSTSRWMRKNGHPPLPGKAEPFEGGASCHYCLRFFKKITVDHIVPLSIWRGASEADSDENKVPACKWCNQDKRDQFPDCACATCANAIDIYHSWVIFAWKEIDSDQAA